MSEEFLGGTTAKYAAVMTYSELLMIAEVASICCCKKHEFLLLLLVKTRG